MNIKRYICTGLSAVIVSLAFCISALAEDNGITVNITDLDLGKVEITGTVKKEGYTVNLLVLKKTENSDDVVIQYQQDTVAGENGEFKFDFLVYTENELDEGWYTVYVGGDGFDTVETSEFYFASNERKKAAIAEINKAANEDDEKFSEIYEGFSDMFDLKSASIEGINENSMYKALKEYVKENNFSENDFAKVKEYYRIYNILQAYSDGVESCKADGKPAMLSELGIDVSGDDVVYNVYSDMTDEGFLALLKGMEDKGYADTKEFEKVFKEQIIIAAILNPEKSGTGHIREILSDEVCEEIGIDISDYQKSKYKTEIEAELLKSDFTDANSLEREIESITASIKKKHSGGGSGNGSGGGASVGGSSNIVIPVQNAGGDYIEEETKVRDNPFSDIDVTHWAYPAVEQLYERRILNGVSADKYNPDAYVTREQLAKIVCAMLGIEPEDGDVGFSDIEPSRWSRGYINVCRNKGYVTGYPDNTFAPSGYVTRQDIAVVLFRVLNKEAENDAELQFTDSENIGSYAVDAVKYFTGKGIIKGYEDNSFKPKKNCTRAEAASIVYAALKEMEGGK